MNKKLLYALGVIVLVVLGYFALKTDSSKPDTGQSLNMEQDPNSGLELYKDSAILTFNKSFPINEEWSLIVNQFEPDAKISGPGIITSDSNIENNPAIKVDFYKNEAFVHYQIVFKEMPGFHSVKPNQEYLLDFIDYEGYKTSGVDKFSIESANVKIWRIK